MDTQKTNDILDSLEIENNEQIELSHLILDLEKDLEEINLIGGAEEDENLLNQGLNESFEFEGNVENLDLGFVKEIERINTERKYTGFKKILNKIKPLQKVKFFAYYIFVSTIVFFMLLGISNYSAYSKILYSYVNPEYLKDSSKDIINTMDNGKIKVYADETDKNLEQKIAKKIEEDNNLIKQTNFSPKKLVPIDNEVSLDLEITPYENRIIIPKIGKNIPLVDVDPRRGLTFGNLQDIFMTELEKGVLRYPGTSVPGEEGNVFIFGHSSNYPWIKGDYNDVFALLDDVSFGDEIIVYYNQKKYVYIIKEKKVIKPGDVKILNREPGKKELSIMTCWPVGTTINRLIVFGELQEVR